MFIAPPLFTPGRCVITPGVMALMQQNQIDSGRFLVRHLSGDWGDLSQADKQVNDKALKQGARLFSAYQISDQRLWIITEADRSVTTLLLPEEY